MSVPWVEKYRPRTRSNLIGNEIIINGLQVFLKGWKLGINKSAALLLGPAGCGKTSAVYALANDLNFDVVELNASDIRKKDSIREILGSNALYGNLENLEKKRLILMDEVDGISGTQDRGGLNELIKIIKDSKIPVICTANDPESNKIKSLLNKKFIRIFTYERLDEFQIFELLVKITNIEKIKIDELQIEEIAAKSSGDIRAAINELESHAHGTKSIQIVERNKLVTLLELLNNLYRAKSDTEARKVLQNAPSEYYKLLLFIFDETYRQCKTPKELADAYEQIALADLVHSRIMRTQDWSLLKYFFDHIGPGIALSRPSKYYKRITRLKNIPSSFIKRGQSKQINSKALLMAPIIAPLLHVSEKYFVYSQFHLVSKILLGKNGAEVAAWMGLTEEHLTQLMKLDNKSSLINDFPKALEKINKAHFKIKPDKIGFTLDNYIRGDLILKNNEITTVSDDENEIQSQASLDDFF